MRRLAVLAALLAAACWSGEDTYFEDELDCSSMTCEDRLDINITRFDKDPFPPGEYTFVLTPSGEAAWEEVCTVEEDGGIDCAGDTSSLEISLGEASSEFTLRLSFAPSSINIEVYFFSDQFLGESTLSPDYMTVMPNGPQCDPLCFQASVSMEVSAPQV